MQHGPNEWVCRWNCLATGGFVNYLEQERKEKKKEVTKLTMKVITRCIRALRRYQKTKNKTNVTEFETGDSLLALAERCKLCLNCKWTSEKCHEVKDPSPNDSKRRLKHCDLLVCDELGARSQRQQRKTTVVLSSTAWNNPLWSQNW